MDWSESDKTHPRDIPYDFEPRGPKHPATELAKTPAVLVLFSIPAFVVLLSGETLSFNTLGVAIAAFTLVVPLWIFLGTCDRVQNYIKESGGFWAWVEFPTSGNWAPEEYPDLNIIVGEGDLTEETRELLLTEYTELLAEARYRDKLLLRTTYFSLGVVTLFTAVIKGIPAVGRPAIAMLATIIMLSFGIAANSYKDSRDAIWDRIGRLENNVSEFRGRLTSFNTIRRMKLRLLNNMSLSAYSLGLIAFLTIVGWFTYVLTLFGVGGGP